MRIYHWGHNLLFISLLLYVGKLINKLIAHVLIELFETKE